MIKNVSFDWVYLKFISIWEYYQKTFAIDFLFLDIKKIWAFSLLKSNLINTVHLTLAFNLAKQNIYYYSCGIAATEKFHNLQNALDVLLTFSYFLLSSSYYYNPWLSQIVPLLKKSE